MSDKLPTGESNNCKCLTCGKFFYTKTCRLQNGRGRYCCKRCFYDRPWIESEFWSKFEKRGECLIWTWGTNTYGYGQVVDPLGNPELAHRMAWKLRHGVIPEGMCVLHHCDVRACAEDSHLFLGTVKDNSADCVSKMRHAFGEKNGEAKLTEIQVQEIRQRYSAYHPSNNGMALSREFGVSRTQINYIVSRKCWKHI